jgi:tRNA (guanine37-N1)-methyltransferase
VRVPRGEAEATRRRLLELDALRLDLAVAKDGDDVIFPVAESCGPLLPVAPFDFEARQLRPAGYQDLLPWPADLVALAPRAFDQVGDVVVVKVPPELASRAAELGDALLRFHKARAVFHDKGVKDPYRVRDLELIAGAGDALTQVNENGVRLWVDPSRAYFSPRLAMERSRVAALVQPGEQVADLFGGVAPLGVQAALKGALVDSVDLNPDAVALAQRNAAENGVADRLRLHAGDARDVAPKLPHADRVVMNLPHGAKHFLDVAARLAQPMATIHYHEILPPEGAGKRAVDVLSELDNCGFVGRLAGQRVVRNYSPQEAHVVFDFQGLGKAVGTGIVAEMGRGMGPGREGAPRKGSGGDVRPVDPFGAGRPR